MRWRHSPPAALAVELEEEAEGRQQPLCSRLHFLHTNTHARRGIVGGGDVTGESVRCRTGKGLSNSTVEGYLRVTCVQSSGCVVV